MAVHVGALEASAVRPSSEGRRSGRAMRRVMHVVERIVTIGGRLDRMADRAIETGERYYCVRQLTRRTGL